MNNFSARVRQKVQQRSVAVLASVRFLLLLCPRVDKQYVEADTSWELTHEMMSQLKKKQSSKAVAGEAMQTKSQEEERSLPRRSRLENETAVDNQ